MTQKRHSDDTARYLRDVKHAALQLGFELNDTNRATATFRHPNGNKVRITTINTEREARRTIKNLIKASGTTLPLSEDILYRPRKRWHIFRRPLTRAETYQARNALTSHLSWIDQQLDTLLAKKKLDHRAIHNKVGLRELVARELKRTGVYVADYDPERNRRE